MSPVDLNGLWVKFFGPRPTKHFKKTFCMFRYVLYFKEFIRFRFPKAILKLILFMLHYWVTVLVKKQVLANQETLCMQNKKVLTELKPKAKSISH